MCSYRRLFQVLNGDIFAQASCRLLYFEMKIHSMQLRSREKNAIGFCVDMLVRG